MQKMHTVDEASVDDDEEEESDDEDSIDDDVSEEQFCYLSNISR